MDNQTHEILFGHRHLLEGRTVCTSVFKRFFSLWDFCDKQETTRIVHDVGVKT